MICNRVKLQISGPECVRLLNMAAYHRIEWHHVCRGEDWICAEVSLKHVRKILELRKKVNAVVRITEKSGMYFLWKRLRRRWFAAAAGVLSFGSLYVMSLFVWDISFEGNRRYTDSYLMYFVQQEGIYPGMRIRDVSCEELENRIRNAFDDITWVNVHIEGTGLVVEVEENQTTGLRFETGVPCNLTAGKNGTISRIVTRQGRPQVNIGDTVTVGDVLITGEIPVEDDAGTVIAAQLTEAAGEVWIRYADIWEKRIPRRQEISAYQKEITSAGIILFGHRFCLPGFSAQEGSQLQVEQYQWKLFGSMYLPIYSEIYRKRFFRNVTVYYDEKSLMQLADQAFYDFLLDLDKLGVEIIEKNVTIECGVDECILRAELLLEENAVVRVPIQADEQSEIISDER